MKYILKYNESKTQTFVDWLKDIEDHKINENRYKFEFPVKKIFNIDDKVDINSIPKFLKEEKEELLKVKFVGETVIKRFEQILNN